MNPDVHASRTAGPPSRTTSRAASSVPTVLHLNDRYLPLTETWIHNQLRSLRRYRPVVATRLIENLEVFPLPGVELIAGSASTTAVRADSVWFRLTGRPLLSAERIAREWRPDVLHAHFGPEGVRALPLRRHHHVPLVTTFYGYDVSQLPKEGFWRRHYRRLFAEGDAFLAEGPFMRERLIDLGCPPSKVHLQHIGVDRRMIPRSSGSAEGLRVLTVGSFREKKGIPDAVAAFARAFPAGSGALLTILGDGPLRPRIEEEIRRQDAVDRVRLLGYQPQRVMFDEFRTTDIFLLPSRTAANGDTEGGAPVSIIEAQAAGIPVVSTTHADIPEVVQHGVTGLLAGEGDRDELALHLQQLAADTPLRIRFGEAGIARVAAEFDLPTQARRLEDAYDAILRR